MFRYVRALWYFVTGRFSAASDALRANKYVMKATYEAAIKKSDDRFATVKDAVAELITIEESRKAEIKDIGSKVERLTKVKQGAAAAMQARIDLLLKVGHAKQQVEQDADFLKHKSAYIDVSSTLDEMVKRMDEKETDLKERQKQINQFKIELQQMQRTNRSLEEEKNEAIADVAIAQQQEQINSVLNGISADSVDKDLESARKARQTAKAKAKITTELAGNEVRHAESEYLKYAENSATNTDLDKLLNWGEEPKTTLDPAKIPE